MVGHGALHHLGEDDIEGLAQHLQGEKVGAEAEELIRKNEVHGVHLSYCEHQGDYLAEQKFESTGVEPSSMRMQEIAKTCNLHTVKHKMTSFNDSLHQPAQIEVSLLEGLETPWRAAFPLCHPQYLSRQPRGDSRYWPVLLGVDTPTGNNCGKQSLPLHPLRAPPLYSHQGTRVGGGGVGHHTGQGVGRRHEAIGLEYVERNMSTNIAVDRVTKILTGGG